jgi:hypothetical protein
MLSTDNNSLDAHTNIVWNKEVPLKFRLFACCLLRNCIPMTDNLIRRRALHPNVQFCVGGCDKSKNIDHLFLSCDFFGKFGTIFLAGLVLSRYTLLMLHAIYFNSELYAVSQKISTQFFIWFGFHGSRSFRDINARVFKQKEESLQQLFEKTKLQSFCDWNRIRSIFILTTICGGFINSFFFWFDRQSLDFWCNSTLSFHDFFWHFLCCEYQAF